MSKKYRRIEPMTQTIKTDAVATAGAKLTISVPSTMTKEQSEKLAGAFRSQITDANGYRLLANGSIEILVTIDEDIAGGLLASADQAGMPTVDYIRQVIADAMTAYWGSAGA